MQMLITGVLVSLVIWGLLAFGGLQAALKLHREGMLAEKWLLLVPYLVASLLFYGIRYRFGLWFMGRQALHELFSIGAYMPADLIVIFVCVPVFYVISVMKPEWVVRIWVNVPLLVFLPFAIKLFLYFTGLVGWDPLPAKIMPDRSDG